MASVQNIGINKDKIKDNNEQSLLSSEMAKEISPAPLSKSQTRESSYWFAQSGHEEIVPGGTQSESKAGGDSKEQQKDEKLRRLRNLELQEEERLRKVRELELQFNLAKKHREQQEEERRRRIEEAKIKEAERRLQVEERKRQIWEAEQERKEAILRRNMEREARIEARRNAQRNSQYFAFGSSTPRSFDLDLAAIGVRNQGSVLMCSVGKRSEERDIGPPRATSACSLDRKFENVSYYDDLRYDRPNYFQSSSLVPAVSYESKLIALHQNSARDMKACLTMTENSLFSHSYHFDNPSSGWLVGSGVTVAEDCMSRSMVSLSSSATFRGRKRTDITPSITPRERSITPHNGQRGNHPSRAVSMTRLDQLAQPRRTYRNFDTTPTGYHSCSGPRTVSPSMSKSMCNLAKKPAHRPPFNSSVSRSSNNSNMSRSMLHLPGDPAATPRQRFTPSPTGRNMSRSMLHLAGDSAATGRQRFTPSPTFQPRLRPATSMLSVAAPRLTRAARLRAEAASAWNLSKPENGQGKDSSRSPSRPHSSLSGTSDISATSSSVSAVQMRPRTAPRRPRPFSVAGSIVDSSTLGSVRKEPERQPRLLDRNAPAPATKPQRAKSANRESIELKTTKPLTAPKKPILPPKPTELVAKAKLHPVPIKDNLRKMAKPTNKSTTSEGRPSIEAKPTLEIKQNGIKKEDSPQSKQTPPTSAPNPSSTVTSPKSSSDLPPTDVAIESDPESLSQSISEQQPDSCETESAIKDTLQDKIVERNIPKESNQDVPTKAVVENGVSQKKGKDDIPAWMTRSLVANISESSKKEKDEIPASMTTSLIMENRAKDFTPPKPRITSEEEARAALAEKRRLAREQAEREAEQERLRLEEIKRKEEEQRQLEEAEQKRMEEEQIRLAELHRQLEQEKLNKAIEEQKQREKEEQERREEEARQKAEREEQEKKAREEAEKQRIELEEKLRKEEEERAERKRRVEQIMARTRGKSAAQSPSTPQPNDNKLNPTTPSPVEHPKTTPTQDTVANLKPVSNGHPVNGTPQNYVTNSWPFSSEQQSSLPDILNSTGHNGSAVVSPTGHNGSAVVSSTGHNGSGVASEERGSDLSVSSGFETLSSRTVSANEDMSQTNGYSSHEEMSCTTSPEESADMGLLIDIQSCQQLSSKVLSESVDFTKLVEVDPPSLDNGVNNENYLINVDDVNSNLFNSANPFKGYEDSIHQKQDASVTDLLS
ncbi:hypothetical protein JTE90_004617 [Oedothorax gibbosus]|uniref:Ensconsin-like n=1 Tax=Oedothorax gibbosus TaxID=931172 RepID=A0AAV6UQX1_9ARAC|nr:hypothetical protein JTE90_004617 [Oedothorax gibbosus]